MRDKDKATPSPQPPAPPKQPTQPGYRPEPKTPAVEKAKQEVRDANK